MLSSLLAMQGLELALDIVEAVSELGINVSHLYYDLLRSMMSPRKDSIDMYGILL